jgi:hypothetical protein
MSQFVELTKADNGKKEIWNVDFLQYVFVDKGKTFVAFNPVAGYSHMEIKESYDSIRKILLSQP